jgi:hypothetical protein
MLVPLGGGALHPDQAGQAFRLLALPGAPGCCIAAWRNHSPGNLARRKGTITVDQDHIVRIVAQSSNEQLQKMISTDTKKMRAFKPAALAELERRKKVAGTL